LIEVAPGIDIDRDILPKMEFTPVVKRDEIRTMDPRVFDNKPMELRQSMIHKFLEQRIDYDEADNVLFIDLKVSPFMAIFSSEILLIICLRA
jgi:propionate CoA-transferase